MWRPTFTKLRKVVLPSSKENLNLPKIFFSTSNRLPKSTAKLTLVSASVGVLVGAAYGGYTHYKVNIKQSSSALKNDEYAFLKEAPNYQAHYKVNEQHIKIMDTWECDLKVLFKTYIEMLIVSKTPWFMKISL